MLVHNESWMISDPVKSSLRQTWVDAAHGLSVLPENGLGIKIHGHKARGVNEFLDPQFGHDKWPHCHHNDQLTVTIIITITVTVVTQSVMQHCHPAGRTRKVLPSRCIPIAKETSFLVERDQFQQRNCRTSVPTASRNISCTSSAVSLPFFWFLSPELSGTAFSAFQGNESPLSMRICK